MNTFAISQTKEESERAIVVSRNAQINDVRLARAKATADRPGKALKAPITVSLGVKAKHVEGSTGELLVEVSFRLVGSKKDDSSKNRTMVCIECTFEVSYQLRPEFAPTAEQINAFKDGNAIFNCWPYCRQYVQEMILRMGYPPLTLPFLRVVTKQGKSQKSLKSK
jgi:preprotein translocase subunit SecB